jgi:hypothetical protein
MILRRASLALVFVRTLEDEKETRRVKMRRVEYTPIIL